MGETVPARGQSVEGKLLYLLLCFAVSLQLLLNRKIVLGKKKKKSKPPRAPVSHRTFWWSRLGPFVPQVVTDCTYISALGFGPFSLCVMEVVP